MNSKTLSLFFVLFLATASLARGQTHPIPDITGWKKINQTVIDISSESGLIAYLGYEKEYQNPANLNEFVKVVFRFVSIVSIPASQSEKTPLVEVANNYLDNQVNKNLENLTNNESDPFLWTHWKTVIDRQTGQVIIDGQAESWLLNPVGDPTDFNSKWFYQIGTEVLIQNISEPDYYNLNKLIPVGKRYRLNNTPHIIRVDQDYFGRQGS